MLVVELVAVKLKAPLMSQRRRRWAPDIPAVTTLLNERPRPAGQSWAAPGVSPGEEHRS